jgi:hypothetical protein
MNYDYAIHSDFLIHWTGKDIDEVYDQQWFESDKSKTKTNKNCDVTGRYKKRLYDILQFGLWMTEETEQSICFNGTTIKIPRIPKTCFTELKLSESRKHAREYGRLGIGVKRPFLFDRCGRPLIYYGFDPANDIFLKKCAQDLTDKSLLNFFKPMNSSTTLNYDFYSKSEWRILYFSELLSKKLIVDPRDPKNVKEHAYFNSLTANEQTQLKYLVPLDGWFSMIIYPSLDVKSTAQQDKDKTENIREEIKRIKSLPDKGNQREGGNWPIEVTLDDCRNF